MGAVSQMTPGDEITELGFEQWNGCAGPSTSFCGYKNKRMCNQDTLWRSSEEEEAYKTWSGDDDENSSETTGKSIIPCDIIFNCIVCAAPTLWMLHQQLLG